MLRRRIVVVMSRAMSVCWLLHRYNTLQNNDCQWVHDWLCMTQTERMGSFHKYCVFHRMSGSLWTRKWYGYGKISSNNICMHDQGLYLERECTSLHIHFHRISHTKCVSILFTIFSLSLLKYKESKNINTIHFVLLICYSENIWLWWISLTNSI